MIQSHYSKQFDTDMDGVRSAVLRLGGLVEQQVIKSRDALLKSDLALVAQVLADEQEVNRFQVQSDAQCQQLIARRQPIAIDLREVIAAIHAINDLERIGDEAKKVALKARVLATPQWLSYTHLWPLEAFEKMANLASSMLSAALDSYVRHDATVAANLRERDLQLDQLRETTNQQLLQLMAQRPEIVPAAVELVFAAQALERIGDHAKNIAEYVVGIVDGLDLRHSAPKA